MPQVAMIRTKELKITDDSINFKGVEFCREDKTKNKLCGEVDPKKKCITTSCNSMFICSVRSPESLFKKSEKNEEKISITSKMEYIYKPALNKYFACSLNDYIPLLKNQKCDKKQINGIDYCLFYFAFMKGNCGQLVTSIGIKYISAVCPKNQKCIIFPEDGWEEELRLDGHYLKSAKCI
jgi:hypothetical protein